MAYLSYFVLIRNEVTKKSCCSGDHVYKRTAGLPPEEQMISPLPDIQVLDLEPDVEFMVLACDGIWNSMSSKEVIDFVRPRLAERGDNLSKICEEVRERVKTVKNVHANASNGVKCADRLRLFVSDVRSLSGAEHSLRRNRL